MPEEQGPQEPKEERFSGSKEPEAVSFKKEKFMLMLDVFDFIKDKDIADLKNTIEVMGVKKIGQHELAQLKILKIKISGSGWTPPGVV